MREGASSRFSTQPGGREPAPGALALVQEFVNTFFDLTPGRHGDDVLSSPAALANWLVDRGLISRAARVRREDLDRALALRDALRDLLRAGSNGDDETAAELERLNRLARGASVEVRLEHSGPRFVGANQASVSGAIGVLLAIVALAMTDGSWSRIKLCPGRDCGWAFYDHSRNQAGRWCSMSICGGREKARAHYRRRRSAPVSAGRGAGGHGRGKGG